MYVNTSGINPHKRNIISISLLKQCQKGFNLRSHFKSMNKSHFTTNGDGGTANNIRHVQFGFVCIWNRHLTQNIITYFASWMCVCFCANCLHLKLSPKTDTNKKNVELSRNDFECHNESQKQQTHWNSMKKAPQHSVAHMHLSAKYLLNVTPTLDHG